VSRLRVVPIVEGHGEQEAIRTLLHRLWYEMLGGVYLDVLRPIRHPKGSLVHRPEFLENSVNLAVSKLANPGLTAERGFVLILVDADKDCPADLGPRLLKRSRQARADHDIACGVAKTQFETWFVAGAGSLETFVNLENTTIPDDPEQIGASERWISSRFRGPRYSKTVDQPRMCAALDLTLARSRSPSFDKLCRELELRFVARDVMDP
jgi:hypothetical protein